MSFLLDADWIISYLNGRQKAVELVGRLADQGLAVSVIAYGEIYDRLYVRAGARGNHADPSRVKIKLDEDMPRRVEVLQAVPSSKSSSMNPSLL